VPRSSDLDVGEGGPGIAAVSVVGGAERHLPGAHRRIGERRVEHLPAVRRHGHALVDDGDHDAAPLARLERVAEGLPYRRFPVVVVVPFEARFVRAE
jgi:hypothetical protein